MSNARTRPPYAAGEVEAQALTPIGAGGSLVAEAAPPAHRAAEDVAQVDVDLSAQRLDLFPSLVRAVNAVPDSARPELASRLNDVLIGMRAPGDETDEAEQVMAVLESKELHDVIDARGRSCRKEAVLTMMACGFPHALMLDPDDVAFARTFVETPPEPAPEGTASPAPEELEPWEAGLRGNRRLGAGTMAVFQVVSFLRSQGELTGASLVAAVSLGALGLMAAARLAWARPRNFNIATFGSFATMLALTGFVIALAAQSWSLALSPIGVATGLYLSIAGLFEDLRDPPQPGDWDYRA